MKKLLALWAVVLVGLGFAASEMGLTPMGQVPILGWASGTAAYLRFDNFAGDSTGLTTDWLNSSSTPYNGTTWKLGSASIGPFATADSITNTVAAAIKTVEMYINAAIVGTDFADDRVWTALDGTHVLIRTDRSAGQFSCRYLMGAGNWSGVWNLNNQTWHHFGFITDDGAGDSFLYVDGVQRLTVAVAHTIAGGTLHYIGCGFENANVFVFGLIDEVRLSTDSKVAFPTVD